ncbi:hypothetical protein E8E14_003571 [Neopestalotiopsis sp. 37M]|nr:hypothetical protein E8E14_003571 [Neopestalotiopsis sp. 37M]
MLQLQHNDYRVGWICALSKEQTAAMAMLDVRHPNLPKPPKDPNAYTLGSIGDHNIVIACLPKGKYGTVSASVVASNMASTFPAIRFGLMVGIGGGIPPKVRLGDVVVSVPVDQYPGVVQWDLGKAEEGDTFRRTGSLNNPPTSLLTVLTQLESEHEMMGPGFPQYLEELAAKFPPLASKYAKSNHLQDILFDKDYPHISCVSDNEQDDSCASCDMSRTVKRESRDPQVHYGLIASGSQVIKSATFRDSIVKKLGGNVLCVEMEAAGLMDNFPCIVIRGICDYADSHKNKAWQEYSAAVAAAFTKELLVDQTVDAIKEDVTETRQLLNKEEATKILAWLSENHYGAEQSDLLKQWHSQTGNVSTFPIKAREMDMKLVLTSQMEAHDQELFNKPFCEEIASKVAVMAKGMFLLAQLHLNALIAMPTRGKIKRALEGLASQPVGLDDVYELAMKRIESQGHEVNELAKEILSWIVHARQPLSATSLQHALSVTPNAEDIDEDDIPTIKTLQSVCAGLVTIDTARDEIRLIHYTAQEYFERTREKWFPIAQQQIAQVCLTYLLFPILRNFRVHENIVGTRRSLYPFYNYAISEWGHHARAIPAMTGRIQVLLQVSELVTDSLASQYGCESCWEVCTSATGTYFNCALHLAVHFGLVPTVEELLRNGHLLGYENRSPTVIAHAMQQGQAAMSEMLLKVLKIGEGGKDHHNTALLCWAAENGHAGIVRLVLEIGRDGLNIRNGPSNACALALAAENGHVEVVEMLLETGEVDINSEDQDGQTPLDLSAKRGHEKVVMMLMETGSVDINRKNRVGQTPLALAAHNGHEKVVQMLLATAKARIDTADLTGQTALALAAEGGHEKRWAWTVAIGDSGIKRS